MKLNSTYWTGRYQAGHTGWDIGSPSTPLAAYIDHLEDRSLRILVPGAGYGYEVAYLAEQGFENVTVVDLSPAPYEHGNYDLPRKMGYELIVDNFFDIEGGYDLILEQTFFCALPPALRSQYVDQMAKLLAPAGKLRGVLFNIDFDREGPPFGGSEEEYRDCFGPYFESLEIDPCYNSIGPRQGSECWLQATRHAQ